MEFPTRGRHQVAIELTAKDARGEDWELSDHLDAGAVVTFHRGDW
jgi:hypothetical protein